MFMLESSIKKLAQSLFISLSIVSSMAMADGGAATGGGVTIEYKGKPTLRDLVDKSVCLWMNGTQFVSQYAPTLDKELNKIGKSSWVLQHHLSKQIYSEMNYCVTEAKLIQISVEDADGLTIYQQEARGYQMAIRVGNRVYVDINHFKNLAKNSVESVNFGIIHEALHAFLSVNIPERNNKLRSFVSYLAKGITSFEDLTLQMKMNQIRSPKSHGLEKTLDLYINPQQILNPNDVNLAFNEVMYINMINNNTQELILDKDNSADKSSTENKLISTLSQKISKRQMTEFKQILDLIKNKDLIFDFSILASVLSGDLNLFKSILNASNIQASQGGITVLQAILRVTEKSEINIPKLPIYSYEFYSDQIKVFSENNISRIVEFVFGNYFIESNTLSNETIKLLITSYYSVKFNFRSKDNKLDANNFSLFKIGLENYFENSSYLNELKLNYKNARTYSNAESRYSKLIYDFNVDTYSRVCPQFGYKYASFLHKPYCKM